MNDANDDGASPERPRRRPRYRGTHPRRFEEKYKEHDPHRHPETVAKVLAAGKTPAGMHVPIMVDACLEVLRPRPGETAVDATLGYGGHAARLLERLLPGGFLLGLDVDPAELPRTEARMRAAGYGAECFAAVRSNYAGLPAVLAARGLAAVDIILADLGCSSMQLDDPARGFTFKREGPLDMRMNPRHGRPAAAWLAAASEAEVETALREHADEPRAGLLAAHLAGRRFATTTELAAAVRAALPAGVRDDPDDVVRRVFQALRIAVNDEFGALDSFLRALPGCLSPGGRVAVLSFHSGEDRRVKLAFREGRRSGVYQVVADAPLTASPDERRRNPRSAAAKLRWAVRGIGVGC